jgi:hypothetical protein
MHVRAPLNFECQVMAYVDQHYENLWIGRCAPVYSQLCDNT